MASPRIEVSQQFAVPIYSLHLADDAAAVDRDALLARLRVLRAPTAAERPMCIADH